MTVVFTDTTLHHFDVAKPVTVQVDASKKGLCATLVKDNATATSASKAFTGVEQCYVNIEHDLLAVVFGVSSFAHTCLVVNLLWRLTVNCLRPSS